MALRGPCPVPECDRQRRQDGLCDSHRKQKEAGQPFTVIQRPLEPWEFEEEIIFLLDWGMTTGEITQALQVSYEAVTVRLRKYPEFRNTLVRFSATRANELGIEPSIAA